MSRMRDIVRRWRMSLVTVSIISWIIAIGILENWMIRGWHYAVVVAVGVHVVVTV